MSDLVDKIIADLVKGAQASEGFMRNGRASVTVARDGREEKLAGLGDQLAHLAGRSGTWMAQHPTAGASLMHGGIGALGGALGGAAGQEDGHRLEGALRGGLAGGAGGAALGHLGGGIGGTLGGTLGGAIGSAEGHRLRGGLVGAGSGLLAGGGVGAGALHLSETRPNAFIDGVVGNPVGTHAKNLADLANGNHASTSAANPDLATLLAGLGKHAAAGGAMGGAFGPLGAAVGAGAQDLSGRSAVGGAMGSALGAPVGMVGGGLAGATVGVPVGMLVNLLRGQSLGEGAAYGAGIGGFAGAGLGAIGGSMMGGSMGQNAFRPDEKQAALTSRFTDGARAAATAFGIKEAFLSTLLPLAGTVGGGAAARAIGGKVAPKLMARLGTGLKSEAFNQVGSMAGGMVGQKLAPPEQAG